MRATKIFRPVNTRMLTRPVLVGGIVQPTLKALVAECDAYVNGVALRLPVGTVICVTGCGSDETFGKLMSILEFAAKDGETYQTVQGMDLRIPKEKNYADRTNPSRLHEAPELRRGPARPGTAEKGAGGGRSL